MLGKARRHRARPAGRSAAVDLRRARLGLGRGEPGLPRGRAPGNGRICSPGARARPLAVALVAIAGLAVLACAPAAAPGPTACLLARLRPAHGVLGVARTGQARADTSAHRGGWLLAATLAVRLLGRTVRVARDRGRLRWCRRWRWSGSPTSAPISSAVRSVDASSRLRSVRARAGRGQSAVRAQSSCSDCSRRRVPSLAQSLPAALVASACRLVRGGGPCRAGGIVDRRRPARIAAQASRGCQGQRHDPSGPWRRARPDRRADTGDARGVAALPTAAIIACMQSITVLGATGSIGDSTLDVVARNPDRYRVFALSGRERIDRLASLCLRFRAAVRRGARCRGGGEPEGDACAAPAARSR